MTRVGATSGRPYVNPSGTDNNGSAPPLGMGCIARFDHRQATGRGAPRRDYPSVSLPSQVSSVV
jgi:hypothetical protein